MASMTKNVPRGFPPTGNNTNGYTPSATSPNNLGKTALTGHTKYSAYFTIFEDMPLSTFYFCNANTIHYMDFWHWINNNKIFLKTESFILKLVSYN